METKPLRILSASRIKTLETCSWIYWANYHLKLPQDQHKGAIKGTICHEIFEILLKNKHRHHYDLIFEKDSVEASKAVNKLVIKLIKKNKLSLDEKSDIKSMILVGLKNNFFGQKKDDLSAEVPFEIRNDHPRYHIKGFIDKIIKSDKKITIVDYKSSKLKFKGDDFIANIQAMTYTLAAKKIWPNLQSVVRFIFLRFPKSCEQEVSFKDEQIAGFEHYLSHIFEYINKFNSSDAQSNFAKDNDKNKWMCQSGSWVCPFKNSFEYYVLLDELGNIVRSEKDKDLFKSDELNKYKIEKRLYSGCPRFHNSTNKLISKDEFLD